MAMRLKSLWMTDAWEQTHALRCTVTSSRYRTEAAALSARVRNTPWEAGLLVSILTHLNIRMSVIQ